MKRFGFDTSIVRLFNKRWMRFKEKWQMKTPKQKWLFIYAFGARASDLIGITVYGNMQNYWFSYFPGLMGIFYFSTVFYTLWYYITIGEIARGMQSTSMVGIVVTVSWIFV